MCESDMKRDAPSSFRAFLCALAHVCGGGSPRARPRTPIRPITTVPSKFSVGQRYRGTSVSHLPLVSDARPRRRPNAIALGVGAHRERHVDLTHWLVDPTRLRGSFESVGEQVGLQRK